MFQPTRIALASAAIALFLLPTRAVRADELQTKQADEPQVKQGEVRFEPVANESTVVPAPFRLEARTFAFEQKAAAGLGT